MTYKFRFKRHFFYRTLCVIGHKYDQTQDKMILYFTNGGIEELNDWRHCNLKLGPDWVLAQKKYMEDQAGQAIPIRR